MRILCALPIVLALFDLGVMTAQLTSVNLLVVVGSAHIDRRMLARKTFLSAPLATSGEVEHYFFVDEGIDVRVENGTYHDLIILPKCNSGRTSVPFAVKDSG